MLFHIFNLDTTVKISEYVEVFSTSTYENFTLKALSGALTRGC